MGLLLTVRVLRAQCSRIPGPQVTIKSEIWGESEGKRR